MRSLSRLFGTMPPKGSRGRGGSNAAAVGGRASSRIAEKQEAAQQLAQQGAALAAENEAQAQAQARVQAEAGAEADAQVQQDSHPKIENAGNSPVPESSMAPPASNRGRTRGGRGAKSGEAYARRGTRRGSRGGSSIASFQARNTPATSDVYALHQQNAPGEKIHHLVYAHHHSDRDHQILQPHIASTLRQIFPTLAHLLRRRRNLHRGPRMLPST